ncbi:P-loop containing nucleoside triphosphate hydrolase protein [Podospora aff. communis PSN243]|uniref:P-loop containing nucleoside triphosphate hydrolase protein n=1 Tax=Podospora aff. communis PSN243 TaxID=3040156 RepID=A0AAV9G5G6_9PEZI|nr:P-loop containing nucleoside triphosphate hydrolase protein [Podospora aff. communis PSN243]
MDQFYLKNVALYGKLVAGFNPPPSMTSAASLEETTPEMVVSARIRPFLEEDIESGFPCAVYPRAVSSGVVDIHDLYNHPRGRPVLKSFSYRVDKLFTPGTTTEQIYQDLVSSLIPFVQNGGVGTVFAYGQTGSGKTFTISRLQQLAIEALTAAFSETKDKPPRHIHLSIIELAGNAAFDLLTSRKPISILEDSLGTIQLSGAASPAISNTEEALSLIELASSFRRTESTFKNDASSRSHAICRIRVTYPSPTTSETTEDSTPMKEGFLYLVDLAGSEAARDVATHGADRMRETKEINMSLSVLKDCIRGRAEFDVFAKPGTGSGSGSGPRSGPQRKGKGKKPPPRIPFRQSALTKVLKHVFDTSTSGRECRTVVIACVNPSLGDVAATKNTLRYAEMLRVEGLGGASGGSSGKGKGKGVMGWSNGEVREWIVKETKDVPISPEILAPMENGAEMLRMSALEFEYRCCKSPGVTLEQAKALRLKLWQLHAES